MLVCAVRGEQRHAALLVYMKGTEEEAINMYEVDSPSLRSLADHKPKAFLYLEPDAQDGQRLMKGYLKPVCKLIFAQGERDAREGNLGGGFQ